MIELWIYHYSYQSNWAPKRGTRLQGHLQTKLTWKVSKRLPVVPLLDTINLSKIRWVDWMDEKTASRTKFDAPEGSIESKN